MGSFYENTNNIDVLRERIEELSRIRSRYACQLGSSLYDVTKDNDSLRWGRESLYMGIADCDEERQKILDRISALEFAMELGKGEVAPVEKDSPEPAFAVEETSVPSTQADPEPILFEDSFEEAPQIVEAISEQESQQEPFDIEPNNMTVEPLPAPEPVVLDPITKPSGITDESAPVFESEPEPEPVAPEVQSSAAVLCPVCGEPANEGDVFCMNCGSSLAQAEPADAAQEEQAEAEPQVEGVVCPNCGAIASETDRFCMECGATLHANEAPEPLSAPDPNLCPSCGNPIDPSFKFCMTCGHKLI